jgi:tRNA pseudouridine-54 N-methylase
MPNVDIKLDDLVYSKDDERFSLLNVSRADRVDLLCRCVSASFFLGHQQRKDTILSLVLLGNGSSGDDERAPHEEDNVTSSSTSVPTARAHRRQKARKAQQEVIKSRLAATDAPSSQTISVFGDRIRCLRVDERNTAAVLRIALQNNAKVYDSGNVGPDLQCLQGVQVRDNDSFADVVTNACATSDDAPHVRLIYLCESGMPINEWMTKVGDRRRSTASKMRFVIVIGDQIGITQEQRLFLQSQRDVECVKLGNKCLLTSHCIVLMHYFLDQLEASGCA